MTDREAFAKNLRKLVERLKKDRPIVAAKNDAVMLRALDSVIIAISLAIANVETQ